MKIIFDSEKEKTYAIERYCPEDVLPEELRLTNKRGCSTQNSPNMEMCKECWEKAVDIEVKGI